MNKFDIIIVGAGNAGIEAATFLYKKKKLLLLTNNIDNIGTLSCNPSMGGLGKSNLIKEIDQLGGNLGNLIDTTMIHYKNIVLNKINLSRAQIDRNIYKNKVQNNIKKYNILSEETAIKLLIKNGFILGIKTNFNIYKCKIVIITTGTFLNGIIYIGNKKFAGGRINESNRLNISKQLNDILPDKNRFKTGTSPRISGKLNYKNLVKQKSEIKNIIYYSNSNKKKFIFNLYCWNLKIKKPTINIIKNNLKFSPIYNDLINGVGPRYCPSIEDKVYRFYKKSIYNILIEPENIKLNQYYLNGLSISLPLNLQKTIIKSIKNFKNNYIIQPGYTIEYDFFNPKNLKKSLESKVIKNLYLAGQINGTTGYEEASIQGLLASINSKLKLDDNLFWYPNKLKSYLGILIDDLTKINITEPYRISKLNLLVFKNNNKKILKNLNFLNFYKNKIIPNINFNKINKINIKERNKLNNIKNKNIYNIFIKLNFSSLFNIILFLKNY